MSLIGKQLRKSVPLKVVGKIQDRDCTVSRTPEEITRYLPVPLVSDEVVIILEDSDPSNQFVKVRHNRGKNVSTFSKQYFRHVRRTVEE